MTNIIVEGLDNSGKSTLVKYLSEELGWDICQGQGPSRFIGDMTSRVNALLLEDNRIFDRHPVVTNLIYDFGRMKMGMPIDPISVDLAARFYKTRPLFIYCDPLYRRMEGHVFRKATDLPTHIHMVEECYDLLLVEYRRWAFEKADLFYRIGGSMTRIKQLIVGYLRGGHIARLC